MVESRGMPCSHHRPSVLRALALVASVAVVGSLGAAPAQVVAQDAAPADDASAGACASPSATLPTGRPADDGRPVLFDDFVKPLMEAAGQRRKQVQQQDPLAHERIDADLNARRLNIALLGYGEEHEQTYADEGVSVTVLSLDLETWQMAAISLSRDIRVPELEQPATARRAGQ
jgi:hypothetical protein